MYTKFKTVSFALGFVLYILTYAYISGSAAVLCQTLRQYFAIDLGRQMAVVLVTLFVGAIVWSSSKLVGRVTTVLLLGKFIAFFMTFSGLLLHVEVAKLFDIGRTSDATYLPYVFMTLPFAIISFGFHGNVPSLVKHYGKQPKKIVTSITVGSFFALFLYILWLMTTMGNISRVDFIPIIAKGGNIDVFVVAMGDVASSKSMQVILTFFGNFAVASSLLAATLGLFDYIADLFKFSDNPSGRFKTAMITYFPPAFICFFFPNGFIYAIGYAGLAFTLWSVILPPLLVKKSRQRFTNPIYKAPCNTLLLNTILVCGNFVYITVVLDVLGFLPTYQ